MRTKKDSRDQFFDALLSLKTTEECHIFFEDIATGKELEAFIQRYQVARRLVKGDTYETIEFETNARSSMISRIKQCLNRDDSGLRAVVLREMNRTGTAETGSSYMK